MSDNYCIDCYNFVTVILTLETIKQLPFYLTAKIEKKLLASQCSVCGKTALKVYRCKKEKTEHIYLDNHHTPKLKIPNCDSWEGEDDN